MDGWKASLLLGWPILRDELLVSGSVTISFGWKGQLDLHQRIELPDVSVFFCICEERAW